MHTFGAGEVLALLARYVIPRVPMRHAQRVNAILVLQVVRLVFRPESEVGSLLTGVHKGALNTSVVQPDPGLLAVVPVLSVHIFFLVVDCDQVCAHIFTRALSGQPTSACGTREVAIAVEEIPARFADV